MSILRNDDNLTCVRRKKKLYRKEIKMETHYCQETRGLGRSKIVLISKEQNNSGLSEQKDNIIDNMEEAQHLIMAKCEAEER